ncbi:MAG: hypothetical protein SFV81_12425 [Pirellulaceae bacterium]|nr:hypothetical protein [Pirellulaceae bacterium]
MRRLLVVVTVVASGFGSVANAQFPFSQNSAEKCPPSSDSSCTYDYYRNKMWPAPFTAADTNAVTSIFDQQRSNGWRLHNTLSTAMFDPRTNCLTDAGKAHVKWIVTNAPQARRVVFVLQDANQQVTSTRVESTQLAISEVIPVGPLPQIYLTDREPSGSSGVYQTAVHRAMANSVPSPRLTAAGGSSGSSGSGTGTP